MTILRSFFWAALVWLGVYLGAFYSVWFSPTGESMQAYVPRQVDIWKAHFKAPPPPPKPVVPLWPFAEQQPRPQQSASVTWGDPPPPPQFPEDRWNRFPH